MHKTFANLQILFQTGTSCKALIQSLRNIEFLITNTAFEGSKHEKREIRLKQLETNQDVIIDLDAVRHASWKH